MRAIQTLCLVAGCLVGTLAAAQAPTDAVVARLKGEGFEVVAVEQTMLGRIRIEARRDGARREIVLDRATGEILRDYTEDGG